MRDRQKGSEGREELSIVIFRTAQPLKEVTAATIICLRLAQDQASPHCSRDGGGADRLHSQLRSDWLLMDDFASMSMPVALSGLKELQRKHNIGRGTC